MREIKWVNMKKYKRESVCVVGEGERRGGVRFWWVRNISTHYSTRSAHLMDSHELGQVSWRVKQFFRIALMGSLE